MRVSGKKLFLCAVILFGSWTFCAVDVNAQLLKKIKKKVESRVEDVISDKVADEAEKETSKSLERIWDSEKMKSSMMTMGSEPASLEEVPESYVFEWVYVLNMTSENADEQLKIEYLLTKDAPYWGVHINEGMDLFMVSDMQNKLNVMFMNNAGNAFATVTKISDDMVTDDTAEDSIPEFTIKEIPGKEILGYACNGYEVEDEQYVVTMYSAPDTEVSLGEVFGSTQEFPGSFGADRLGTDVGDGVLMEMIMVDKDKPNKNISMKCVKFEKQYFKISKKDYSAMPQ